MKIDFIYDIYGGLRLPVNRASFDKIEALRHSQFVSKKGKTFHTFELELTKKSDKMRFSILTDKTEIPSGDFELRLLDCKSDRGVCFLKFWL